MSIFFQQIVNGLVLGSSYALIALGLTMIYGILYIANFAHGPIYMLGAYFCYFALTLFGIPYLLSIFVSMAFTALVGITAERIVFRPLRDSPHSTGFIGALGLFIIFENIAGVLWGHDFRSFPPIYPKVIKIFGIYLTVQRLLIVSMAVLLIIALDFLVRKTALGRRIRAVAQDRRAAALVGISVDHVSTMTFAIGSALAAAAGALLGPILVLYPTMGAILIVKAFVVIILGGMGSIRGAILGGYILGVVESLGAGYISSTYRDLYAFVILILVLSFKPQGLMGKSIQ